MIDARFAAPLAALALLASCAAPPADHYHTLRMPASGATPGTRSTGHVLAIGPVTVPASLQRPGWVVRENDMGVRVYEHQLWTQDLADEIAQALADDLNAGSPAASRPWADPAPTSALTRAAIAPAGAVRVRVQVLRFDARLGPRVGVSDSLRWTLECGTTQETGWHVLRSEVRDARMDAGTPTGADGDVSASFDVLAGLHAQVLALLAGDIAGALDESEGERARRCAAAPAS